MKTLKIVIPELPPSLNELLRMHYRGRMLERDKWVWLVAGHTSRQAEPFQRARVKITYYFPDKRRRDPDNYAGGAKNIMDAIVARGLLADDSFQYVELTVAGEVDREHPRTEIEITEIAEKKGVFI